MGNEFGKDGSVTKFCEGLPVIGYVASAGHAIAGDNERAKRAAAAGTNGFVTMAGAVGGGLVGGPAGAIAGASVGNMVGQVGEHGINETTTCKTDKGDFSDFSAGGFIAEAGLSAIGTGAGGTVGKSAAGKVVGESVKKAGGGGMKRYVTKRAVESAVGGAAKWTAKQTGEKIMAASIHKAKIVSMDQCPAGLRRITIEEVMQLKDKLLPLLDEWDIIMVAGGKIDGRGYGNKITAGEFGWGWVFLIPAGFSHYDKIFIDNLGDIPTGWRRLTVEEARSSSVADKIRSNLGQWDIYKLAGGKFDGPGYGSKLHEGYYDKGCGWVVVVCE